MGTHAMTQRLGRDGVALLVLLGALMSAAAHGQVASQGRATLSVEFGQGSGPSGAVAEEIVKQQALPNITQHSVGWRIAGGYNYADHFGIETAISRIGYMKNSAPYLASDSLSTQTVLNVFSIDAVGRLPLTSHFRLDGLLGVAESALITDVSTALGSSLPVGQSNPVHVRRFGVDGGVNAEWRTSDHLSLLLGYHAYPNVGSSRVTGSANGLFSMITGGFHVEF